MLCSLYTVYGRAMFHDFTGKVDTEVVLHYYYNSYGIYSLELLIIISITVKNLSVTIL